MRTRITRVATFRKAGEAKEAAGHGGSEFRASESEEGE
jgi:hypothetical protein